MIKTNWERKKIGELFDVQLGKMLNEKAKQGDLYPYLANFNVRWGTFDLTKLNMMHFNENEKRKFSLKYGDLLMCEGGEIGRCAVWNKLDENIYYQKALHRLRPLYECVVSEFV
jgi:type I restriction enzyme, S subunit